MKSRRISGAFLAAALAVAGAAGAYAGQGKSAWTLESVLHELDAQARDFHGLSADIERTKVTVVVNDRSTETGSILVDGEKMRLEMKSPSPRTILRNGDNIYVYTPGLKRVEEYNLGKHRALVDQYLLLGFGTSGKELHKGYLVTLLGEASLDGHKVVRLELTPKSGGIRDQISKIHIWFDETSWLPVQQQFFETGSEDYFIIRYSNAVRNPHIPESAFKPRWPKDTARVKPQS